MTILVTGATGTIGRHVVAHLAGAGHPVRAVSRHPERASLPRGVETLAGDLTRPETLAPALDGATAMHLIAIGGDDYRPLTDAGELVDSAVAAGVKRFTVLTGSDDELAVVRAVEESGADWTHVRPLEFMSNKLAWADAIRTEGVVRSGFGEYASALVHESDVAAVVAAALTRSGHAGRTYRPTGPEVLTRVEAAAVIADVTGRPVRFVELSEAEVRREMRDQGIQPDVIDFVVGYESAPPPEASVVLPVVQEVTGRPPRTFAEWVGEHAAAFTP